MKPIAVAMGRIASATPSPKRRMILPVIVSCSASTATWVHMSMLPKVAVRASRSSVTAATICRRVK